MRKRICLAVLVFGWVGVAAQAQPVGLAGEWRFAMDRGDAGVNEQWFNRDLSDRIKLPGILQSQGYGDEISTETRWVAALPRDMRWYLLPQYQAYTKPGNVKVPYLSQPPRHYIGVAWYQRDIEVPEAWRGKRVHLFMERPRWETSVWVGDRKIGSNNSLVAPHEYELGILPPGRHRLSVRADTRTNIVPGYRLDGHSISDALGNSWNGIAGRIEISATSPVWIDDAQVFPNVAKKSALVRVTIGNLTGQAGSGTLVSGNVTVPVQWTETGGQAELEVPLGNDAKLWDEFQPAMQRLTVQLKGAQADDQRQIAFGLREIEVEEKLFKLNGREINLRGTHHGGDFPLTGYPATDVAAWKRIIQVCKDFGLNHIRFHSYCPPDAAFTAADELGFYLQVECGMWNPFNPGDRMSQMLELETARIMKAFGNHPSFVFLAASNETSGRWQGVLNPWAEKWYKADPRHLICTNTGRSEPATPGAQFAITPYRNSVGWFGRDYSAQLRNAIMPVIAHEVGQWCSYPDFDLIKKFTGYMQPGNYEIFRDSAAAHGMLERNKEFAWNSGKFQLACYKQEIEANLRTPMAAGFQLLDLHDYVGQGGALVGLLDPFWDPKSHVTAEMFRRFCSTTVPLARMTSLVMTSTDTFDVPVEIAHYAAAPIESAKPVWKIVDLSGVVAAQGEFPARSIPIGKNIPLGNVKVDLKALPAPRQYKLVVGLQGTAFENDWNFWLYPATPVQAAPAELLVSSDWNEAAARLAAGGKVMFIPTAALVNDLSPPLNNVPVFWNRLMVPKLESMMGLLVDPKHPALAGFPSETFCDWQWTELVRNVRAINIETAPKELQPIVQAIDDWNRNYKLGVIFECTVGTGRLIVSSIDVQNNLDNRVGARQLRQSLLDYLAGERFRPQVALSVEQANALWPGPNAAPAPATRPQALPGDVVEGANAPRPGRQ